jgi:hypothetical protein
MLFEIQRALGARVTLLPPVSEEIRFGSQDEAEPMDIDSETPHVFDEEEYDEDDITITELMWDIHNDITLAELARQVTREEKRLKKKDVDETIFWMRSMEHLPSF